MLDAAAKMHPTNLGVTASGKTHVCVCQWESEKRCDGVVPNEYRRVLFFRTEWAAQLLELVQLNLDDYNNDYNDGDDVEKSLFNVLAKK